MNSVFQVENVGRGLDYISQTASLGAYFDAQHAVQHVFTPFERAEGVGGPAPYDRPFRPSRLIGPTDEAAALTFSTGLANRLQVIDKWVPNTDWGGGMLQYNAKTGGYDGTRQGTYPTPWWQDRPPLELPRYNYAAMDSQALYDEARQRVAAFQALLFGAPTAIGGNP